MTEPKTPSEVVAQAQDNSWWNKDPLVMKAAAVGIATSIAVSLGAFGLITDEQRTIIIEQVGNITFGVFVILPLVISLATALWARLSVFSPRTAARAAVTSATTGVPTLMPPP